MTLNIDVSDEEMAARKAKWQPREPKVTTGYLARYASYGYFRKQRCYS